MIIFLPKVTIWRKPPPGFFWLSFFLAKISQKKITFGKKKERLLLGRRWYWTLLLHHFKVKSNHISHQYFTLIWSVSLYNLAPSFLISVAHTQSDISKTRSQHAGAAVLVIQRHEPTSEGRDWTCFFRRAQTKPACVEDSLAPSVPERTNRDTKSGRHTVGTTWSHHPSHTNSDLLIMSLQRTLGFPSPSCHVHLSVLLSPSAFEDVYLKRRTHTHTRSRLLSFFLSSFPDYFFFFTLKLSLTLKNLQLPANCDGFTEISSVLAPLRERVHGERGVPIADEAEFTVLSLGSLSSAFIDELIWHKRSRSFLGLIFSVPSLT